MNSRTKITLWAIVLVLIVIISIFGLPFHKAEAPVASGVQSDADSQIKISYTLDKQDEESSSTSIEIVEPKISGLSNKAIDDAINSKISSIYKDLKGSFIADTAGVKIISSGAPHQLIITGTEPLLGTKHTFYIDSEIYSFYSGAAHPRTARTILNFVKDSGQLIRLQDILKKNPSAGLKDDSEASYSNSLTAISNIMKPKILAQLTKMAQSDDGSSPDPDMSHTFDPAGADPTFENYGVFYIHADSIEWVFGQYQVAPYVFGEIKVLIPMSELKPYLADREWLK